MDKVEQAADELFDAMMKAPYGAYTTLGSMACCEITSEQLREGWVPLLAAALRQQQDGMCGDYKRGVEAAIRWVEKRRHEFEEEYGRIDPSTNAMEFGNSAREEYDIELCEIEEGLRSLIRSTPPSPASTAGREAVAFSIVGPDGVNSIHDHWLPMSQFAQFQKFIELREGHRPVFAYTAPIDLSRLRGLAKEAVAVLGPNVPSSVTDEGARWEWDRALRIARELLAVIDPTTQAQSAESR